MLKYTWEITSNFFFFFSAPPFLELGIDTWSREQRLSSNSRRLFTSCKHPLHTRVMTAFFARRAFPFFAGKVPLAYSQASATTSKRASLCCGAGELTLKGYYCCCLLLGLLSTADHQAYTDHSGGDRGSQSSLLSSEPFFLLSALSFTHVLTVVVVLTLMGVDVE